MEEKIEQYIVVGKLEKPFMGYKTGATIFSLDGGGTGGFSMNIIFDEGDEFIGYAIDNISKPKIIEEERHYKEKYITQFNTYFSLTSQKVKIPVTYSFFM